SEKEQQREAPRHCGVKDDGSASSVKDFYVSITCWWLFHFRVVPLFTRSANNEKREFGTE
ncbi:hypothetical protein CEXT_271271, partial [Caerostris extrusa]